MLLENGGEIRLGDIIGEGAVTKDNSRLACGVQFLVPVDHTERQRFDICNSNPFGEAHQKRPSADTLYLLSAEGLLLDGHTQVKPKLQQQFVEDVNLVPVGFDVVDAFEQCLVQVIAVRFPGANVGGV